MESEIRADVIMTIVETATGKKRNKLLPNFPFYPFYFHSGNASCDCNRELYFDDNAKCGEVECGEGRFIIEKIVLKDDPSVILYTETIKDHPNYWEQGELWMMREEANKQ